MRNLFPRYLARLQEFREDIEDVRIKGHTSEEWGNVTLATARASAGRSGAPSTGHAR